MTKNRLDILHGTLEFLVLKALSGGGEMHGFAILDWIRDATDHDLVIEEGAMYPALHRMERRRWLTATWGISERGRRAKYYRLTRVGERALAKEEAIWDRYVAAVAKISARAANA
jgi:transcriptional regulator